MGPLLGEPQNLASTNNMEKRQEYEGQFSFENVARMIGKLNMAMYGVNPYAFLDENRTQDKLDLERHENAEDLKEYSEKL